MPINIGDKPQADFNSPLELMMDCHRRIERFLRVLQQVAQAPSLDEPNRAALRAALDYFKVSGPRHNQDEEQSLLPAMLASGNVAVAEAVVQLNRLTAEHAIADQKQQRLGSLAEEWLRTNVIAEESRRDFQQIVESLINLYQPHIAMEEQEIFPLASRVLAPQALACIGEQMRQRRQSRS